MEWQILEKLAEGVYNLLTTKSVSFFIYLPFKKWKLAA